MSEWISAKDRLPEESEMVLVCYESGFIWLDNYIASSGKWVLADRPIYPDDDDYDRHVAYWQPLPPPPKDL